MASVVYECPRGVFTRIMEGPHGYELYLDMKKVSVLKLHLTRI